MTRYILIAALALGLAACTDGQRVGVGLTDRNFVSAIHNAGGQTNLVVDDNGSNWWPFVDIGRFAWFIPESSAGLESGDTATLTGSFGRDANGFRFYEEELRLSGALPTLSIERQGASVDSVRATLAFRSTNRSLGNSGEIGFPGANGEMLLKVLKSGGRVAVDNPFIFKGYTVAGVPSASTMGAGASIFVSNGDAGSPCLAVSNGTNWLRVPLGAAISAT